MAIKCALLIGLALFTFPTLARGNEQLLRVGVVGLSHDHVHAILGRHQKGELEIVGIIESNRELVARHAKRYGYSLDLVFDSLDAMLDRAKPQIVSDYGTTSGHLRTVEAAAPRGIHVMVEKPLAATIDHARQMQQLADKHSIHLLTNYETTWYASHYAAKNMLAKGFGDIRKIVVHDGHQGPKEIGCSAEFVEWLTDPKLNGGGALMDFGCYGANLATWLMNGQRPLTVTAVTQQIKPDVYPEVEDEATIVLTYPAAQVIIQASWNWDYNRKDIEIYCQNGHVHCLDGTKLKVRKPGEEKETTQEANKSDATILDPYQYFSAVIRGDVEMADTDLSALTNNMLVAEILDAAQRSAKSGTTIRLSDRP